MQAKLFALTSCSVAEFMLKLPFPPPFATLRAGISQLKVNLRFVFFFPSAQIFRLES
jgi:hypothetical protein